MPEVDEAAGREDQEAKGRVKKERPPKPPKEKKEKPPKAQKPPKVKPVREKKAKGEKKPMKAGMAALITALVFLALTGGAAAAVITDFLGGASGRGRLAGRRRGRFTEPAGARADEPRAGA